MKHLKILIFILTICNLLFSVGEAGAIFLLISPGAAAQGTGEANVARVDDAYSSYYNPAALAFQTKRSIAGMHVNWLKQLVPDLYYEYIGFAMPQGSLGGIGGHLIFLSLGDQQATDEVGNYLGSFSSYMWALDAAYGTKLTNNSALGLGFKVYHQKLADAAVAGESGKGKPYSTDFAFDISYLYKYKKETYDFGDNDFIYNENLKSTISSYDKYRIGLSIANIGPPITFIDEEQADPAPTNMRLGLFANLYKDKFSKFNVMIDMQKLLVAKYPSMDWDGDGLIGEGPGNNSYKNSEGQNEGSYSDPWYKAWATAWLDDWYYGGDLDWDGDKQIGGWYWVDGWDSNADVTGTEIDGAFTGAYNNTIEQGEMVQEGNIHSELESQLYGEIPEYSSFVGTEGAYKEMGSGADRSFSNEFNEIILNTGFEFWYTDSFVLRCGYIYDNEGDIKNPTFGAGLRFGGYGFDFGYTAGSKSHPRSNSLFFSISAEI
jgi:hypothetical protein